MWASFNRFELEMTLAQAQSATHSGSCDDDVLALTKEPRIARQLRKFDPAKLALELLEYGAWDDEELADHAQNLQRITWIAAGNITDEACAKGRT
jgi:hypothetical protein